MNETVVIAVLVIGIVVLALAVCGLATTMWWRANAKLMWFHNAGQSIAAFELEKARLAIREREIELQQKQAEVEMVRAQAVAGKAHSPNGAQAHRLTGVVTD